MKNVVNDAVGVDVVAEPSTSVYPSLDQSDSITTGGQLEVDQVGQQPVAVTQNVQNPDQSNADVNNRHDLRVRVSVSYKGVVAAQLPPDLKTVREAMSSAQANKWKQVMSEGIYSLQAQGTFSEGEPPAGTMLVDLKWDSKEEGLNCDDIYAPADKHSTLRTLLSMAANEDLNLMQLDVKNVSPAWGVG